MGWEFEASGPMGGAAGEAYANTLKSPGMVPEHVLAREAIQNSVDAGLPGEKVAVRFRATALTNNKKKAFIEASGIEQIAKRASALELAPNALLTLDRPRTPLKLLYVEDYNAEGLSGDAHDKGSNFFRLLLSLGDRSKARSARGTGGSYGFGKSVYSSSSAIQTIVAYTRFKAADGKECTRIFGCGYYASHEFNGKTFSGRAWLGSKARRDDEGRVVVDPLQNAAAEKLAAELGFELRGPGELGTSILIVDSEVDMAAIMRGVEDWWWPRLVENKLDVEIMDADGVAHVPRPKRNPQLKPFIEAFEIARQLTTPKPGNTQKFFKPNAELGLPLGTCGFVVVPPDAQGNPTITGDRSNSVALIRAPLMVVAYKSCSDSSPPMVGAYVASDEEEVDIALKKSEPPAHDRWDPDSANLRDESGRARTLVVAVLNRVRGGFKRFQGEAAPATPAKQRRLTILERVLSGYFKPQGRGGPVGPDSGPSPLHLEWQSAPHAIPTDDGMLRLTGTFVIRLDDKADDDDVPLRLRVNCPVMEDDNEEGDDLALNIACDGVNSQVDPEDALVLRFRLSKKVKARFKVESEPYSPAWTVRLRPDIEKEEA